MLLLLVGTLQSHLMNSTYTQFFPTLSSRGGEWMFIYVYSYSLFVSLCLLWFIFFSFLTSPIPTWIQTDTFLYAFPLDYYPPIIFFVTYFVLSIILVSVLTRSIISSSIFDYLSHTHITVTHSMNNIGSRSLFSTKADTEI